MVFLLHFIAYHCMVLEWYAMVCKLNTIAYAYDFNGMQWYVKEIPLPMHTNGNRKWYALGMVLPMHTIAYFCNGMQWYA
jgi:hypothetical protein